MRTRTLAAPLLSLAALPLLTGGASAVTPAAAPGAPVVHADETGDTATSVDIAKVTTSLVGKHDGRLRVKVAYAGTQRGGDSTFVFFDLDRRNRGPELRLVASVGSELSLNSVDNWSEPGREATCEYWRFGQNPARTTMTGEIDLDCLGTRNVRFEVRSQAVDDSGVDWLGTTRRFQVYETR